jgi:hypothetical protein
MKPKCSTDKSQSWFWSKKWQAEEKKVQDDIDKDKLATYRNVDELIEGLNKRRKSSLRRKG